MATTPRLLLQNALYGAGVLLKSTPSEDPDMLAGNVLVPSRQRFWRPASGISYPSTQNLDFDLVSSLTIGSVGVARLRAYRGGAGATSIAVSSGTGTTYPTITWTLRATITVAAGDNNLFADVNQSARWWRFAVTGSSQWGLKAWLVTSANIVVLTEGAQGALEVMRQLRAREAETVLGGRSFNRGAVGTPRDLSTNFPILTQAQLDALIASERGNVVLQHVDGKYYEIRHLVPVKWEQVKGATVQYSAESALAEVP